MLKFLQEMLASTVTFTLKVYTRDSAGYVADGGLLNVDEVGLTIDDPHRGFVLFPWSGISRIEYEEG